MRSSNGRRFHSNQCSRQSQRITETNRSSSTEVNGEHQRRQTSPDSSCAVFRSVTDETAANLPSVTASKWSERENGADHWCGSLSYPTLVYLVQRSIQRRRQQQTAFDSFFIDLDRTEEFLPEEFCPTNDIHVLYRFIHDHSLAQQNELHTNQILILTDEHETKHQSRLANAPIWLCTTFTEVSLVPLFSILTLATPIRSRTIPWNVFWSFKFSITTMKHSFPCSTLCYRRTIWTTTRSYSPKCSHWKVRNLFSRKRFSLVRLRSTCCSLRNLDAVLIQSLNLFFLPRSTVPEMKICSLFLHHELCRSDQVTSTNEGREEVLASSLLASSSRSSGG